MPRSQKPFRRASIPVQEMVSKFVEATGTPLDEVNGVSLSGGAEIVDRNLHRPGLVLTGYLDHFVPERIQILGNTETHYLLSLSDEQQSVAFDYLISQPIPCIVLTSSNQLPRALIDRATDASIPVFSTTTESTYFMAILRDFLDDQFAPQLSVHGSLVDVYGVGLLLMGRAGIGKSEIALDLVERGHRLVADDVVMVTKKEPGVLIGSTTDLVQHFMEIRGVGIVDVRSMFGIRAIRFQKRVELVIDMDLWDESEEYTRLQMYDDTRDFLGVDLPRVKLPITPGKNVTVICEVIAMNYLLQHYGYDPAKVFTDRLADQIKQRGRERPGRGITWFERDFE